MACMSQCLIFRLGIPNTKFHICSETVKTKTNKFCIFNVAVNFARNLTSHICHIKDLLLLFSPIEIIQWLSLCKYDGKMNHCGFIKPLIMYRANQPVLLFRLRVRSPPWTDASSSSRRTSNGRRRGWPPPHRSWLRLHTPQTSQNGKPH